MGVVYVVKGWTVSGIMHLEWVSPPGYRSKETLKCVSKVYSECVR